MLDAAACYSYILSVHHKGAPGAVVAVVGASISPDSASESFKGSVPAEFSKMLIIESFLGSPGAPIAPSLGDLFPLGRWAPKRGHGDLCARGSLAGRF